MSMKAIVLVLDSFGIGGAHDAAAFGDEGSNTYLAISHGINVPILVQMGLNNIDKVSVLPKCDNPIASFGRMVEKSVGKDTTTGHFELMGLVTDRPYPTYPNGFGEEIIKQLVKAWNVGGVLGNKSASGTQIINELGKEHLKSGYPIVYTSADSVLQIACHDSIYPIERLYDMCKIARHVMCGENNVARIIARPFSTNSKGEFYRTADRKDFGLVPSQKTTLNKLQESGVQTFGIGKINDIFSGYGIDKHVVAHTNEEVINATIDTIKQNDNCFIFSNLVDFDMLYGHRNDVEGYRKCLEYFDRRLPELVQAMDLGDLLIITADHGCDPSTPSTDHSRENVPLLVYQKSCKNSINLGEIIGFDWVGNKVEEFFDICQNK